MNNLPYIIWLLLILGLAFVPPLDHALTQRDLQRAAAMMQAGR